MTLFVNSMNLTCAGSAHPFRDPSISISCPFTLFMRTQNPPLPLFPSRPLPSLPPPLHPLRSTRSARWTECWRSKGWSSSASTTGTSVRGALKHSGGVHTLNRTAGTSARCKINGATAVRAAASPVMAAVAACVHAPLCVSSLALTEAHASEHSVGPFGFQFEIGGAGWQGWQGWQGWRGRAGQGTHRRRKCEL